MFNYGNVDPLPVPPPLLDPLESTPQTPPTAHGKPGPEWPLAPPSEGFHLVSEPNNGRKPKPGRDGLDGMKASILLKQSAASAHNWSAGIQFRHRTWRHDRARVLDALESPQLSGRRFWRFRDCGSEAIVYQDPSDPTRYKVGCKRCHDRFCLPCSQDRARLILANIKEQLPEAPTRFLTLTLKHSDEPLPEQLDRLYDAFKILRRREFWREKVSGGVAFLELKLSRGDSRWHPHLHVLIRGKFLPQKALSDLWLNITGDSHIVDVRMAKHIGQVYRYLVSYVTKGWDVGLYRNRPRLCEAIHALKGRKLLTCFGDFAKLHLLKPPEAETWKALGTLAEIQDRATLGDAAAIAALETLQAPGYVAPPEAIPPEE